jgi:glycosyltransferase involved in cell wall biosynthesis
MASQPPRISAVIAARNAAATLSRGLDALTAQAAQAPNDIEVIVVDDYSTDNTREVVARYPVRLIAMPQHVGVAAARNRGAEAAQGQVLFFLDADVVLAPGGIGRVLDTMARAEIDAMIGSYDAEPEDRSIVSRFKNLAHHHFHQRSSLEASTFWGACGAIRREQFCAAGGFDEKRFKLPSIEDVELGSRLIDHGVRIVLDPGLQVKHLKKWTLTSMVTTDVTRRAIPWTLLWMERRRLHSDLNFSYDQRIAALLPVAVVPMIIASLVNPYGWLVVAALLLAAYLINRDLFRLLYAKGGLRLAAGGFFLQQLYYLYSLFGLAAGSAIYLVHALSRRQSQTLKQT